MLNFKRMLAQLLTPSAKTIAHQLRKPSGFFAKQVGLKMNDSNRLLYKMVLDEMELQAGDSLLEIGFGNGNHFEDFFIEGKNILITGIDFSRSMVEQAVTNNRKRIKSQELNLQLGDSKQLPFPDNSFDQVYCINVIYFWENPAEHLSEIFRVLKPGGLFYTGMRPETTLKKLPFTQHGFIFYSEEKWIQHVEESGLSHVGSKTIQDKPILVEDRLVEIEGMVLSFRKN